MDLNREHKLLVDCQKNDAKSQKELFELHSSAMYRVALRYVTNTSEAEDVVVVAFTKIFKTIQKFSSQGKGSLAAWIRKVVVNECLMLLRNQYNFNLLKSLDEVDVPVDLQPLAALQAEDILAMVAQLPTGYRTVFNLFAIEGYNHGEISKQLNISEGTSRSQLSKAREQLKRMLNNENNDYGT